MVDPDRSVSQLRKWAERLVTLLDDRFRIPGTDFRFGLDPVIGLLFPGIGDVVDDAGATTLPGTCDPWWARSSSRSACRTAPKWRRVLAADLRLLSALCHAGSSVG